MRILAVNGGNTLIHSEPWPIMAPVDQNSKVFAALIATPPPAGFEIWQDVSWYFSVDFARAALVQRPGVDLTGTKILVFLE